MANELIVPSLGESITEATVTRWLKKVGDSVKLDETLVELETDKVTLEVNAPVGGILEVISVPEGQSVGVGYVLGRIEGGASTSETTSSLGQGFPSSRADQGPSLSPSLNVAGSSPGLSTFSTFPEPKQGASAASSTPIFASPAAHKMMAEAQIHPQNIPATGPGGRITKTDVYNFNASSSESPSFPKTEQSSTPSPTTPTASLAEVEPRSVTSSRGLQVTAPEERVRMTRLRQRIAERLKEAQNTAAMLTTFNEIDMSNVMATRESYRDKFEKRFGIKLGFMSFFVKAAVSALKEIPSVNAEIQGDYIVYKNHYDIGVAVSAPQGLVVPVVRDADHLNFAEIEMMISQLGEKARTGKLSMDDLSGGTFTVTNGGVFGSLMSTPIINPPQSGILGMHKIQKRPIVIEDRIEIRPMMYVALTYDHRIIDGREAVTFLVRIKENIEDPQRILLGI